MFIQRMSRTLMQSTCKYNFTNAVSVDYYKLLGIGKQATNEQIHNAYAAATKQINPDSDPFSFNKLSEAFVILTDNKARDAYDSLLRSYKVTYINEQQVKEPKTRSYLTQRKAKKREQINKKFNLDQFGRYRGGLPQAKGALRGKSQGQIGQLYETQDLINGGERFPDYQSVNAATAQSFKDFHQDERQTRTIKRPWVTFSVDYDFFTTKNRFSLWSSVRWMIVFAVFVPALYEYYLGFQKRQGAQHLRAKRVAHKAAQQAKIAASIKKKEDQLKAAQSA